MGEISRGADIADARARASTDFKAIMPYAEAISRDRQQRDRILGMALLNAAGVIDHNEIIIDALAERLARSGHLVEAEIRDTVFLAGYPVPVPRPSTRRAVQAVLRHFPDAGSLCPLRRRTHGFIFKPA